MTYINAELAGLYWSLCSLVGGDIREKQQITQAITEFGNNITKYYEKHQDLKDLDIPGVHDEAKSYLEELLQFELAKAVKHIRRKHFIEFLRAPIHPCDGGFDPMNLHDPDAEYPY